MVVQIIFISACLLLSASLALFPMYFMFKKIDKLTKNVTSMKSQIQDLRDVVASLYKVGALQMISQEDEIKRNIDIYDIRNWPRKPWFTWGHKERIQ